MDLRYPYITLTLTLALVLLLPMLFKAMDANWEPYPAIILPGEGSVVKNDGSYRYPVFALLKKTTNGDLQRINTDSCLSALPLLYREYVLRELLVVEGEKLKLLSQLFVRSDRSEGLTDTLILQQKIMEIDVNEKTVISEEVIKERVIAVS